MIRNLFTRIRSRAHKLSSSLALLSLAGSSLVFTSCTTEEGVIAGALAGAAIGGVVGHSHENAHKRNRHIAYRNNDHYGYRNNNHYRGREYYRPRQSRYSGYGGYRSY